MIEILTRTHKINDYYSYQINRYRLILRENRIEDFKKLSENSMHNIYSIEKLYDENYQISKKALISSEKIKVAELIILLLKTYFDGSKYIIPNIIGKIGKNHIKLLIENAFNNENKIKVRQTAIESIAKIGNKSVLKFLYKLLEDNNVYIRKSVILALADIGDKHSIELLLDLLDKENDWIKGYIIWTLGLIGDFRSVDKLIQMLSIRNLQFNLKKNIIIALDRIGDKKAIDILIKILNDSFSGLEDYISFILEKIGDKRAIPFLIKNYLKPIWFLKEHNRSLFNKFSQNWKCLINKYESKIYKKENLSPKFFEDVKDNYEWHYGYLNKSHYIIDSFNEIIGCSNLIFLSVYENTYIFYFDTIEIKRLYRRLGLGTKLIEYIIKNELMRYEKFNLFLLVANCEQYKLKFFSQLGFVPVKLRETIVGTHCIMTFPYNENSEKNCLRMFEYFNWREEKKEIISSDCKYAYNPNPTGLYWCAKKKIYVSGLEKQNCPYYVKEKEILRVQKFLNLGNFNCKN